jgi:hypothetical protein
MSNSPLSQKDQALLTSAFKALRRAPRTIPGSEDVMAVGTCIARYEGKCRRCEGAITPARHLLRYDHGYGGWVHAGCQQPRESRTEPTAASTLNTTAPQRINPCPHCHLEHRGDCW